MPYTTIRRPIMIPLLIMIVAALLRVGMLARDVRFHADEALYATYARQISRSGDLLLQNPHVALDKPPLALMIMAAAMRLWGEHESAARLPQVFASLISVALLYRIAYCWWGQRVAMWAGICYALSPYDITFAATAFLDPLLTCLILGAIWLIGADRWLMAGVLIGLALWTKQTTPLFLPLIVLCGLVSLTHWRDLLPRLPRLIVPILISGITLALWSAARAAPLDFWTLHTLHNSPDRWIRANELLPRLFQWVSYLNTVNGFAPLFLWGVLPLIARHASRQRLLALIMVLNVGGMLCSYWLIAFNTYDRYIHTLSPLLLMLMVYGIIDTVERLNLPRFTFSIIGGTIIALIGWSTVQALQGKLPIGGDQGKTQNIRDVVQYMKTVQDQAKADQATPPRFYTYWLDWQLGYYLNEGDPTNTIVPLFQPSPVMLARTVCSDQHVHTHYLILTADRVKGWQALLLAHEYRISTETVIADTVTVLRLFCDGAFVSPAE